MACCGSSVGSPSEPLNAAGCHGDYVPARYVGTAARAAGKDFYGFAETGQVLCISRRDLNHPNFEQIAAA